TTDYPLQSETGKGRYTLYFILNEKAVINLIILKFISSDTYDMYRPEPSLAGLCRQVCRSGDCPYFLSRLFIEM
ncbi:hypothetical protein, partial [Duncaniella dubosii]|uniref:hypothetical protein n=1 Tax=Duncaniella dubosii TaxID=2518971 RepID=UPI003F676C73